MIDKPTVYDVFGHMRFSDFVGFGLIYGTGLVTAFMVGRQFPNMMQKLLTYHTTSHFFFVFGAS